MHFRCVFTLLLCYVPVGLNWAESMVRLYLHVTCSCILMHTYLQVSIFVILSLVGAFLIFSLSPSLSVSYVSCVMAPKRKFILSRNPLLSEASFSSSPSNPTPFHIQFHDEKAKSDFLENFSRQGIHLECQTVLLDFSNTDLPTIIYGKGWESLCGASVTCPSTII